MNEEQNLKIMTECCRFAKCNVNICPLDSFSHLRNALAGEEKCGVAKSIRLRIGKKHNLLKLGLTNREYAAYQLWEAKSEKEKEAIRSEARKRLNENRLIKTNQNQS